MILGKLTRRLNDYLFPFFSLVMLELLQHTYILRANKETKSGFLYTRGGVFWDTFFYFFIFYFFFVGKKHFGVKESDICFHLVSQLAYL